MDWLNYHHLLYFWLVAREGSISRAAMLLHVTPATISIQVKELEKALGVKLFRRAGRGLALTEMGEMAFRYADDIFSMGRELVEMVRGRPAGSPLLFRVGVNDVMPKLVAYKLIAPMLQLTKNVRLIVTEGRVGQLVSELGMHKLDLVLSDTPMDPPVTVRAWSHLLGESSVVVLGVRSLASRLRDGFPGSLDGAPFLLPTENSVLRRSIDVWFSDHQLRPDIRGEFQDSAMLKIAGQAGAGAFLVPEVIQTEVQAMYGVELIGHVSIVRERFYAISAERKLKHPAVVAISDAARRRLGEEAQRREG